MKQETNKRKTDALVVLVLFGVFAVLVLAVLLTGADAYRRLARRDQQSYDRRTAAQYILARVRQSDSRGGVAVCAYGDGDALVFTEQIGDRTYETWVYCSGGYLREQFAAAGAELPPDAGEEILRAGALRAEWEGNLLCLYLTDTSGEEQELNIALRSAGEVTP